MTERRGEGFDAPAIQSRTSTGVDHLDHGLPPYADGDRRWTAGCGAGCDPMSDFVVVNRSADSAGDFPSNGLGCLTFRASQHAGGDFEEMIFRLARKCGGHHRGALETRAAKVVANSSECGRGCTLRSGRRRGIDAETVFQGVLPTRIPQLHSAISAGADVEPDRRGSRPRKDLGDGAQWLKSLSNRGGQIEQRHEKRNRHAAHDDAHANKDDRLQKARNDVD